MSQAEVETIFRFDHEERVLWACTASDATARRWERAGLPVRVLGRTRRGASRTWAVQLDCGSRSRWLRCFSEAIPENWALSAAPENEGAPDGPRAA